MPRPAFLPPLVPTSAYLAALHYPGALRLPGRTPGRIIIPVFTGAPRVIAVPIPVPEEPQ